MHNEHAKRHSVWPWLLPALATQLAWGIWAFIPKIALENMQPNSVIFFAGVGNLILIIPFLWKKKFRLQVDRRGISITLAASLCTFVMMLSFFYALKHGPVGVVATIAGLYPVITIILARVILNEKINRMQAVAILFALAAIYLLAAPSSQNEEAAPQAVEEMTVTSEEGQPTAEPSAEEQGEVTPRDPIEAPSQD